MPRVTERPTSTSLTDETIRAAICRVLGENNARYGMPGSGTVLGHFVVTYGSRYSTRVITTRVYILRAHDGSFGWRGCSMSEPIRNVGDRV